MRNFYKDLKLPFSATEADIRKSLSNVSSASRKEDIEYVLLNPRRRESYNRNCAMMKEIGLLRGDLRLTNSKCWDATTFDSFMTRPDKYPPLLNQLNNSHSTQKNAGSATKQPPAWAGKQKNESSIFKYLLYALIVGIGVFFFNIENKSKVSNSTPTTASTSAPAFSKPAKTLPYTGVFLALQGKAPFEVRTSSGTNYFIKLCTDDGASVLTGFIRGGETLATTAPLGRYQLKYATGKTWYGEKYLFGPSTQYHKAGDTFNFNVNAGRISGYTVELIMQRNGNLNTYGIAANEF